MSQKNLKNIAASVRQKILNKARRENIRFSALLQYYAMERFLYRLAISEHSNKFILKGALLLRAWGLEKYRPTMDIDLLGLSTNNAEKIIMQIADICSQSVLDDGLSFDINSVKSEQITEGADYIGSRILFSGKLDTIKIKMQIDIGFGDSVFPKPIQCSLPEVIDFPSADLMCYQPETTIAEKFNAMIKLDMANSRMKDFYDIWLIMRELNIDKKALVRAVRETFDQRNTIIPPLKEIVAFTPLFYNDKNKNIQWKAFLRKKLIAQTEITLKEVCNEISEQLKYLIEALKKC